MAALLRYPGLSEAEWPPSEFTAHPGSNAKLSFEAGDLSTGYARYWLPLLGPATTVAYLYLRDRIGETIDLGDMATDLGMGGRLPQTLQRGAQFGVFVPTPAGAAVPTRLPRLTVRQLDRLRPELARQERLTHPLPRPPRSGPSGPDRALASAADRAGTPSANVGRSRP